MPDNPTPEKILQTGLAFWPAKTLLSAIEIGVFTELAQGPADDLLDDDTQFGAGFAPSVQLSVERTTYLAPPTQSRRSADVETLIHRYALLQKGPRRKIVC